jgi:hypothetical protein
MISVIVVAVRLNEGRTMIKPLSPLMRYKGDVKELDPLELLKSGNPIEEAPFGAIITKVGLHLPEQLDLADWEALGRYFARTEKAIQWAIGDWWAYGHQLYGDKARQIVKELPYERASLRNLGYVARAVKPSSRNDALSFSHHRVVADARLSDEDQVKWLNRAVRGKWSVNKLSQKLHEHIDSDGPEHQAKLARNWAHRFEQEALKPTDRLFYSDHWLPFLSSATVRSLAELAAKGAKAWGDIAESIEQASQQRNSDPAEPPRRKRLH